ncbi:MAG TPA: gluconate 2-dehydrogenase subunit 3 family protein [Bryobacteraceae bacterium]|jgi:hypothetical protein|nr:gluconate 2-dehydrogenase subunit 3 family protein [Bryobacteraceae bacterium]
MTEFQFDRRELIKLLGFGVAAELLSAHEVASAAGQFAPPSDYLPRFLTKSEYQLTSELCEIVIPTDDQSPGAKQAGVPWFIDTVLLYANNERKGAWRTGLSDIDAVAVRLKGDSFLRCSEADRLQVVQKLAQDEEDTTSREGQFFGELKALAIEGFCLSDLGMTQYLHYRGNVALAEFPGCAPTSITGLDREPV